MILKVVKEGGGFVIYGGVRSVGVDGGEDVKVCRVVFEGDGREERMVYVRCYLMNNNGETVEVLR